MHPRVVLTPIQKERRAQFDSIATKFGIIKQEDWYQVNYKKHAEELGKDILPIYESIQDAYPEFEWHSWNFNPLPRNYWNNTANRKRYIDWLSEVFNITHIEQWKSISKRDILQHNGGKILRLYGDSILTALSQLYPENPIKEGLESLRERTKEDRLKLDAFAESLGLETQEEWYMVSHAQCFATSGISYVLSFYGNSLRNVLEAVYPEFTWYRWRFHHSSPHFFDSKENQRQLIDAAAEEVFYIEKQEDWYKFTSSDFIQHRIHLPSTHYNGSLVRMFEAVYEEFVWYPWLFEMVPRKFWSDKQNQRKFLDWFAEQHQLSHQTDWCDVTHGDIQQSGGGELLQIYGGDVYAMLENVYTELSWQPKWLYRRVPDGYWQDVQHQREYFEWLGRTLQPQITDLDDWYKISQDQIIQNGGSRILYFCGTVANALKRAFPEHEWYPWMFHKTPRKFWKSSSNVRKYVRWLAEKLNIKEREDWHHVTFDEVANLGGRDLWLLYGGLDKILAHCFPEHKWHTQNFYKPVKSQYRLITILERCEELISAIKKKTETNENDVSVP